MERWSGRVESDIGRDGARGEAVEHRVVGGLVDQTSKL
jgi:hypothetical protein